MRKIKNSISKKDRIVCESIPNKLRFSYKATGEKDRIYLFETAYSHSLYQYFRDNGCRDGKNALSMTINQFYRFHEYHNKKLAKTLERIPAMVDYVLTESAWDKEGVKTYRADRAYNYALDDARTA